MPDTTPIPLLVILAALVITATIIFVARAMHPENIERKEQR